MFADIASEQIPLVALFVTLALMIIAERIKRLCFITVDTYHVFLTLSVGSESTNMLATPTYTRGEPTNHWNWLVSKFDEEYEGFETKLQAGQAGMKIDCLYLAESKTTFKLNRILNFF